ncbi:hypothetical protein SY27_16135 [Flavobacterium sp. 316]|uniref:hypothetical protein n=1 Tax=Flavobacterium sp. 316 TaxID=1603293 RepID=UPI0005DC9B4A|nr:hypothetical protein [Flavobacterium sp. 316]KIX20043.1 hypothetical protein SY27_16135 [Flavobacterium sp. 316]
MYLENIQLDFYKGFEGEDEIRFYANPKDVLFKRNEKEIILFRLWNAYFSQIIDELISNIENEVLPKFIIDYNILEGWTWNNEAVLILEEEINWFIEKIESTILNREENIKDQFWSYECIINLYSYLKFVIENNLELRISKE